MATTTSTAKYEKLFNELKRVSHEALASAPQPTPMIVGSPSTPLGSDVDPNQKTWFVEGGICGFANVVIDSGRIGFAQWLLKSNFGNKAWQWGGYKGVTLYSFARYGFANAGQSYERNVFIAQQMAKYLNAQGIKCHVDARID